MKIVVECSCQVPYEFEIEPVDGQMPGPVLCPTCGADGTEYANWVIQDTLAREQTAETPPPGEPAEATDEAAPGLPKF